MVQEGEVAALVSTLDAHAYDPVTIETGVTNVDWLKPRAVAHDRVVTWASDTTATIPLPMWTLFSDDDAIRTTLRDRAVVLGPQLQLLSDAREYTVRLFVDVPQVHAAATTLSPRLAEIAQSLDQASPGQRYLLQRKLESETKIEVRALIHQIGDACYDALTPHALRSVRETVPQGDGSYATLNASFLVHGSQYDEFRRALTAQVEQYGTRGFRFDFTGPWPAYHFARVA